MIFLIKFQFYQMKKNLTKVLQLQILKNNIYLF